MSSDFTAVCPDIPIETAEIIVTGYEITSGKTLDTNSRVIARHLREIGIDCLYISTVGDERERLEACYRTALSRVDLIISCGGLGPTDDDLCMELAAQSSGLALEKNQYCENHIRSFFKGLGLPPSENNWKQAYLPHGAEVLPNERGTACGAVFTVQYEGKARQFALLPGPPGEMERMLTKYLLPRLRRETVRHLLNASFRTAGIGESALEMKLRDLIRGQKDCSIATYAGLGEVLVRVSREDSGAGGAAAFSELCGEIRKRLHPYLFEEGERSLAEVVVDRLHAAHKTVSFAESCTAGLLSSELVAVSGASEVFPGGFVVYSDEMKEKILSIPRSLLERGGAVSERCALAMAAAARSLSRSDIGLSATGYAGPGGGCNDAPAGTVYIALDAEGVRLVERHLFRGERNQNRFLAATAGLDLLRRYLEESGKEDCRILTKKGTSCHKNT